MGGHILKALFLAASARQVFASCAYGTHLQPRAEGEVKINTFGYTGQIVCVISQLEGGGLADTVDRDLLTGIHWTQQTEHA